MAFWVMGYVLRIEKLMNVLWTKNTWLQLVSVHHVAGYTDIGQCDSIFCSWAKEKKSQANFP